MTKILPASLHGLLVRMGSIFLAGAALSCSSPGALVDSERISTETLTSTCELGQECCPDGYKKVTLTQKADSYTTTATKQCVVALGGSDQVVAYGRYNVILGGDGDENIMANASVVRGGAGNDTIHAYVDPDRVKLDSVMVYGGPGDDTIAASQGNDFIVPGPGNDTVDASDGDDTVALYNLCEITGFKKNLDGGAGHNTLITPVDPKVLVSKYGFKVQNFQEIRIEKNSCKSECVAKPDCSGNGVCKEDPVTGALSCRCNDGMVGDKCQTVCTSLVDSDDDKKLDCEDLCPYDKKKTAPEHCGCGTEDVDTDGDGTYDCNDRCPQDRNYTEPGDCGCAGLNARPAGTPCTAACPGQADATCNADGVCGNPTACMPDTNCKLVMTNSSSYWVCSNARTFDAAGKLCAAKGLVLARVDTFDANTRVHDGIAADSWLGGNAMGAPGVWRWSQAATGGDQFYAGNAGGGGREFGARFHFWTATTRPTPTGKCLVMRASDGRWFDDACSASHPYVCEYSAPVHFAPLPTAPIPNRFPTPIDESTCIDPHATGERTLPETPEELEHQVEAGVGSAAANVAPGTKCPTVDDAESCTLADIRGDGCTTAAECLVYGADYICGQDNTHCPDDNGDGGTCLAKTVCGRRVCLENAHPDRCDQVDFCPEPGRTFDTQLNEGAPTPTTVTPKTLFTEPPSIEPSKTFQDPGDVPREDGTHRWCSMRAQDPGKVQPAGRPDAITDRTSGNNDGDTGVKFDFDPDVIFQAHANPLAFGESNMRLHAEAGITASVALSLFGKKFGPAPILSARAKLVAQRCNISTTGTELEVLGRDFIEALIGGNLETEDLRAPADLGGDYNIGENCERAVSEYQHAADRAKKAYRDAEHVLKQYRDLKNLRLSFGPNLCKDLQIPAFLDRAFFPGGNSCPENEPPELTINRLIRYYQDGHGNQIDGVRAAAAQLSKYSSELLKALAVQLNPKVPTATKFSVPFTDIRRSETKNVIRSRFAIGPVPMIVEVDVVAAYGLRGALDLELKLPTNLGPSRGNMDNEDSPKPEDIARARVSAEPYAAAGLSLFAGADIGVASAGIEGALSLARISAPIHAGAGLSVATTTDTRPMPTDAAELALKQVVSGVTQNVLPFGPGVRYRFYASYDYGADIVLADVLSGEVNGKARIRFPFYSRTWRKRIFKFTGWGATLPLLGDSGTQEILSVPGGSRIRTASGNANMGVYEPEAPIVKLAPLAIPAVSNGPPTGTFAPGELGAPFYDQFCCVQEDTRCGGPDMAACCPGLACYDSGHTTRTNEPIFTCQPEGRN